MSSINETGTAVDEKNNTSSVSSSSRFPQPLYTDRVLVAFTAAYLAIFVIGVCGNVFTCLVVIRKHYIHSQTPFYLNLAFSDLLLLAGLPADVYFFWHPYRSLGGSWFCILKAVITESATNASILTIVIFTADRWMSISYPSKSTTNFSRTTGSGGRFWKGKNGKYVVAIWSTAVIAAAPLSAQLGLIPLIDSHTGTPIEHASVCHIVPERAIPYSFEASSLIFFILPMILITVFYSSIIYQLRRTTAKPSANDSPLMHEARGARQQAKASAAVVKILIAVVVAFFICFSPHHLQRLLASYISTKADASWATFSQLLFTISGLSYYISTAVNPVIYCLLSKRFRFAPWDLLVCRKKRQKTTHLRFSNDLAYQVHGRARDGIKPSFHSGHYADSCPTHRKPCTHLQPMPVMNQSNLAASRPRNLPFCSTCLQHVPRKTSQSSSSGSRNSSKNRTISAGKWRHVGDYQKPGIGLHEHSDCYNVYYDGDRLVISFITAQKNDGCSI